MDLDESRADLEFGLTLDDVMGKVGQHDAAIKVTRLALP